MANHLFDLIRAANPDLDRPFARLPNGQMLSYGALFEATGAYAHALVALEIAPGERVAVQVEKSIEMLILYLACLRAGAVFLPLNTGYTPAEIGYFLSDAEPRLFVCDPAQQAALLPTAHGAKVTHILTLDAQGAGTLPELARTMASDFADMACGADDLAAILYTSGTTGRSKGAMLSHDNLAANALTLVEEWRFKRDDVLIHALPIFHTHGLFVATNVTLLAGSSLIFMAKFEPESVIAQMKDASVLMGVPTFYTRLLHSANLTPAATAGMRLFISGSAPLLAETHSDWQKRTGHAILERYGMSETNMNTSNPYDGARIAGTVGLPLPGTELRITDPESGARLPQGEIGMIEVKGPNVFKGYWRMPEKTMAEFRADGFFITGDLGMIDALGYVHIVGRGKDLIITGGFNVYPKEVESEIDALPGVVESAVIGVAHPDFGEGVVAVVVARSGAGNAAETSEARVLAALQDRLAKFKLPKRVFIVAELPRNTMGKVQKNLLRTQYEGLFVRQAP